MNSHERAFVESFVNPARRERFLDSLSSPQRRRVFNAELYHPRSNFLSQQYIERVPPGEDRRGPVAAKLRRLGAPDVCWVFGNDFGGEEMGLEDALDKLIGEQSGTIISCLPGKLAFLESENGRMILRKT